METRPTSSILRAQVLDHLKRYRVTTKDMLNRSVFLTQDDRKQYQNVIHRTLMKKGLIESHEFRGAAVYYQLTAQGAREIDAPPDAHKPLTLSRLYELYAELLFCCYDEKKPRPKLTTEEFNHWFPERLEKGRWLPGAYFIDEEEGVRRLGRILVDTSKNLANARDTALRDVTELGEDFLTEGRFMVAIVAPSRGAARDAQACMKPIKERGVRVVAVDFKDQLSPILGGLQKSASAGRASVEGTK